MNPLGVVVFVAVYGTAAVLWGIVLRRRDEKFVPYAMLGILLSMFFERELAEFAFPDHVLLARLVVTFILFAFAVATFQRFRQTPKTPA